MTMTEMKSAMKEHAKGWTHVLLVAAAYSLYILPFMRMIQPRTDEGSFLVGAVRIVNGQVFGRDFFEVMGPGTFYWLAAFFRVFGVSFFAARLCTFISSLLMALLIYYLASPIKGMSRHIPVLVVFGTYFSSVWPAVSHHTDSNCLSLLAVSCMVLWLDRKSPVLLVLAGVMASLATITVQPKGILIFFAILSLLLVMTVRQECSWKTMAWVTAGYTAVLSAVIVFFYAHGALKDLYFANVSWPMRHYSAVNDVPYGYGTLKFYWHGGTAAGPLAFALACLMIVPFLFVTVLPALAPVQVVFAKIKVFSPRLLLYIACGMAIWISELHRKDITHLVVGAPLLVVVSVMLMAASQNTMARVGRAVLATTALCVVTCNLILALTAHPVSTRVGQVAMLERSEELQQFIARTTAGQETFVYPYCPSYYFLSATVNPTPYSLLMSGYHTPAEFAKVISDLDQRKPKYALWDTNFRKKVLPLVFPAALKVPDDQVVIEAYLESHYATVYDQDGFRIMERAR